MFSREFLSKYWRSSIIQDGEVGEGLFTILPYWECLYKKNFHDRCIVFVKHFRGLFSKANTNSWKLLHKCDNVLSSMASRPLIKILLHVVNLVSQKQNSHLCHLQNTLVMPCNIFNLSEDSFCIIVSNINCSLSLNVCSIFWSFSSKNLSLRTSMRCVVYFACSSLELREVKFTLSISRWLAYSEVVPYDKTWS